MCLACLTPLPVWLSGDYFEATKASFRVLQFSDIPHNILFDVISEGVLIFPLKQMFFVHLLAGFAVQ